MGSERTKFVTWARATRVGGTQLFIEDGETVTGDDDFIRVTYQAPDTCFATDDSGGLYWFSMVDGRFKEIDRDRQSKITSISVARW